MRLSINVKMSDDLYDVVSTLRGTRSTSILDANLIASIQKNDPHYIDQFIKSKGLSSELDDYVLRIIINKKFKLLKKLISVGLDINKETIHGRPIIMTFYKGGVNHEAILFLLKYKIDVNFRISYNSIQANFFDLAIFLLGSNPIIDVLIKSGGTVNDKSVIPFGLNLYNNNYNLFVIKNIYSPNATYNGVNIVDHLINYDYKRYTSLVSSLNIDPIRINISTRIILICRLLRESINQPMVLSLLDSLPRDLVIDANSLPTRGLEFNDFIAGMSVMDRASGVGGTTSLTIDTNYILTWFFNLACDTSMIQPLREAGINLNDVSVKLNVNRDWQLALLQSGIGGKSTGSFIKLRSKKSNSDGSRLTGKNAKNINKYILSKEIIKYYESYVKSIDDNSKSEAKNRNSRSSRYNKSWDQYTKSDVKIEDVKNEIRSDSKSGDQQIKNGSGVELSIEDIKNMQVELSTEVAQSPRNNSPCTPRTPRSSSKKGSRISDKSPRSGSKKGSHTDDKSPRTPRDSSKKGSHIDDNSNNQEYEESIVDVNPSMISELRSTLRLRGKSSK